MFTEWNFTLDKTIYLVLPMSREKTLSVAHIASHTIVLSPSLNDAISQHCNSVHTAFPRQQWMTWLCIKAQQASNPNRDKISLFLSRLHNGSGGKRTTFSHYDWAGIKKTSEIWLQHLREASPLLLGMTCCFLPPLPAACRSASFLTTNRLLLIHRNMAREYA